MLSHVQSLVPSLFLYSTQASTHPSDTQLYAWGAEAGAASDWVAGENALSGSCVASSPFRHEQYPSPLTLVSEVSQDGARSAEVYMGTTVTFTKPVEPAKLARCVRQVPPERTRPPPPLLRGATAQKPLGFDVTSTSRRSSFPAFAWQASRPGRYNWALRPLSLCSMTAPAMRREKKTKVCR